MSTNQITHNNHYIPQFYLKNWSQDGISIYAYSLLVHDSRIPYWNRRKKVMVPGSKVIRLLNNMFYNMLTRTHHPRGACRKDREEIGLYQRL